MTQDELIRNLGLKAEENKRREEQELLRYSRELIVGTIFVWRFNNMTIYYKVTSLHPYYSNYVICSLVSHEEDDNGNVLKGIYIAKAEFDLNELISNKKEYKIASEDELAEAINTICNAMR